jgi:phosphoserine phosphatase
VISGGLLPAVQEFARALGLPAQNVRAVPIHFDQLAGEWWRYDRHRYGGNPDERYRAFAPTPLMETQGKRAVIAELAGDETRSLLVGDGVTDLEARGGVKLFVGFGGVVRRERVAAEADVFIEASGLASVVPLALSASQASKLIGTEHESVLARGRQALDQGQVNFQMSNVKSHTPKE